MFKTSLNKRLSAAALAVGLGLPSMVASDFTYLSTMWNTDWTYAGVGGLRNNGSGNIALAGVSGTISKAYLYWHGPQTANANANAAITFAGSPITGVSLGLSSDNCWNFPASGAYRADVTSLVTGNGSYSLANMVKSGGDINVNGASLLVFFNDGNSSNNRDVILFDGNDSNVNNSYDANGWNLTFNGINYSGGAANVVFGVSDGQTFSEAKIDLNGNTFLAAGNIFQGNSVPGNSPFRNGNLWDIKSYNLAGALSMGVNNLNFTTTYYDDCFSGVHVAFDLPAGAAPPPPPGPGGVPDSAPGAAIVAFLGLALFRKK